MPTRLRNRIGVVAPWLHGVAHRVALKARAVEARWPPEISLDRGLIDARADLLEQISGRELLGIIDEEVQNLPGL